MSDPIHTEYQQYDRPAAAEAGAPGGGGLAPTTPDIPGPFWKEGSPESVSLLVEPTALFWLECEELIRRQAREFLAGLPVSGHVLRFFEFSLGRGPTEHELARAAALCVKAFLEAARPAPEPPL